MTVSEHRDGRGTTADVTWRLAEEADIPAINALASSSVRALHAGSYDDAIIEEAVEHAYGVDCQLVLDGTYFVATIDRTIVGAGGWSYRRTIAGAHDGDDPAAPRLHPAHDAARIRAFYVDPKSARRGIGALLLRLSEDAARRAGFLAAELTSTFPAVPFYASFGYREERAFDVPLPSGASLQLVLMSKTLSL